MVQTPTTCFLKNLWKCIISMYIRIDPGHQMTLTAIIHALSKSTSHSNTFIPFPKALKMQTILINWKWSLRAYTTSLSLPYWQYFIQRTQRTILVPWCNNWWISTAYQLKGEGLCWSVTLWTQTGQTCLLRAGHGTAVRSTKYQRNSKWKECQEWNGWHRINQTRHIYGSFPIEIDV